MGLLKNVRAEHSWKGPRPCGRSRLSICRREHSPAALMIIVPLRAAAEPLAACEEQLLLFKLRGAASGSYFDCDGNLAAEYCRERLSAQPQSFHCACRSQ